MPNRLLLRTKGENIQECDCCGNASAAHYTTYKSATNHGLPRTPQSAPQSQRHYDTISHFKLKKYTFLCVNCRSAGSCTFPCVVSFPFTSSLFKPSKASKAKQGLLRPCFFPSAFCSLARQHAALNNTQRSTTRSAQQHATLSCTASPLP